MPVSEYFHGHGNEVKKNMEEEYGSKKGEQVFYATANKRGETPDESPIMSQAQGEQLAAQMPVVEGTQDAAYKPVTSLTLADLQKKNEELHKNASTKQQEDSY